MQTQPPELVGQIYFKVGSVNGRFHLIAVTFHSRNELRLITAKALEDGWLPFFDSGNGNTTIDRSASYVTNGSNGVACPYHGTKKLYNDNDGRGKYCAVRTGGKFCGWQSWK